MKAIVQILSYKNIFKVTPYRKESNDYIFANMHAFYSFLPGYLST